MGLSLLPLSCQVVLAGLMVIAAVGDWRRYIIPNWLSLAVAATGLCFWVAQMAAGQLTPADFALTLATQVGLAMVMLILFAALFALGAMGGGDVKLMAALTLWIPLAQLPQTVFLIAMVGGVVSVMAFFKARGQRFRPVVAGAGGIKVDTSKVKVPYGVAIAVGGLVVALEPILKVSVG